MALLLKIIIAPVYQPGGSPHLYRRPKQGPSGTGPFHIDTPIRYTVQIDITLASIVELLKLAGPALSAVLLYLYRQQRVRSSANEAAIASVIEVNDELRKELGRKSQQLLDMENAQNRLEASLDEQRINHATEMNRYIKMREDSARELEFELRAARATIAHLRAEVADLRRQIAEWEKVIKLDPNDYVKQGQNTDTN